MSVSSLISLLADRDIKKHILTKCYDVFLIYSLLCINFLINSFLYLCFRFIHLLW